MLRASYMFKSGLENGHEQLCHNKADKPAARKGEHPGEHHVLYHAEVDGRKAFHRAHAHNGGGFGVCGGNRDAEQAGIQKAQCSGNVGRKTLIFFKAHHIHAHRFNDFFTAHAGAQGHYHTAQKHEPHRDADALYTALPVAEGKAQKQNADEFLAVLRAVHKAHGGCAKYLCNAEEGAGFSPVHASAHQRHQLAHGPACGEAQRKAEHKPIQHLGPFAHVDAADAALNGDGRAGEARNKAVAFAGGNAEQRGPNAVHHNREQRSAQRHQRLVRISAEIHHVADGGRDRAVNFRHYKHAQKVEHGAHDNGRAHIHAACGDAGGNGVGRVRPSVDENHAQRERHGDEKNRVAGHFAEKVRKRYVHKSPRFPKNSVRAVKQAAVCKRRLVRPRRASCTGKKKQGFL